MDYLGYVIQRDDTKEMFVGYRHPGTHKTGWPVWTKRLELPSHLGGKAAIYDDLKTAADIALSIYTRDGVRCTARPLVLHA